MFDRKALRKFRAERNLSQAQLAKMVGCSSNMIAMYERGENNPRERQILRIAKALDVPVTALQADNESRDTVLDKVIMSLERMTPAERAEMLTHALRIEERRQKEKPVEYNTDNIIDPNFEKHMGTHKKKNQVG
ncbi:MAG TPA: helix-turn-helix transcriptional regulator [Phycisphaerae bacterium]|nr:helix-turn-helix transcriptional regulator [Phycisphaerae bacterium]